MFTIHKVTEIGDSAVTELTITMHFELNPQKGWWSYIFHHEMFVFWSYTSSKGIAMVLVSFSS